MPRRPELRSAPSPRRRQESERRHDGGIAVVALLGIALGVFPAACTRRALAPQDAGGPGPIAVDGGADAPVSAGGDAAASDTGRNAGTNDAAIADGADAGGALPCGGALTCTGTDLCVTLNLCGGPLRCDDLPDGGQCPAGSTFYADCPGGRPGCVPACPGPSYMCAPRPASCTGTVTCACLGSAFCPFSDCALTQERQVLCANQ